MTTNVLTPDGLHAHMTTTLLITKGLHDILGKNIYNVKKNSFHCTIFMKTKM